MKILTCILEIIFPTKCGICGKIGEAICNECYNELKKIEIKRQHNQLFFAYRYEGIIRKLILQYKFEDKSYLYKTFTKCLIKNKNVCQFLRCYDIIIPVPLHNKRRLQRGYNQAELIARMLAKEVSKSQQSKSQKNESQQNKVQPNKAQPNKAQQNKQQLNKPSQFNENKNLTCISNILIKNKNIKPQSEKGIKQRVADVKGIYQVKNKQTIKGKRIVLFDDIYTTGSTTNECKRILLEAEAKEVGILTLAKDYIM